MSATPKARWLLWSALSGVISAAMFLAVAELTALIAVRGASPLEAVGAFVIDIVPQPVKEFAIATFGESDKIVLLASLGLAAVIGAAIAGTLEYLKPPLGVVLFGAVTIATAAALVTRAAAGPLNALPALTGGIAAVVLLRFLVRALRRWRDARVARTAATTPATAGDAASGTAPGALPGRRAFLTLALVSTVAAAVVGTGSRIINGATSSIASIRDALRLPSPRSRVTIPAGAELDVPGISPLYTPNADFYRVDTALTVPQIDPSTWRLVIDGMVDQRIELSFDDLVARGLDEYSVTLTCVSNEVGGGLVGNAIWQGIPVRDLLALAGPASDADMVLSRSFDGFTASTPLESLTDDNLDAILAVAMNGEPLPLQHGFPVRMVVPGLYGYVSATKWLTQLTVTRFDRDEAYWTPRGYSDKAPIKMSSRIDTPRVDQPATAGTLALAGVAWAQPIGIGKVEVKIDDADWQEATLSSPVSTNSWVQWMLPWEAAAGVYTVTVRAYDLDGNQQVEDRAAIAPNGSSGWQRSLITVR
ncbi:molybdopterin-dependent oxidoreductase [Microbacterium sp. cx-55]|uniref:molybdopterin-dependent oxidoreductase n=1 Tax=Microbacterium sp. cx-55 TaxID=2875948 RepID=UPI001CBB8745|nr:molybdopterin-dependent oxidoreductase [Microbacterium sp. cx-55]MBZ4488566.1 molybdopterin-dependent oxidoreductase [Microbacterium sp. cx-55]UGB36147.1 molybdopterin-dependent oxidoreductase [Microbacterium sp. cx-55]